MTTSHPWLFTRARRAILSTFAAAAERAAAALCTGAPDAPDALRALIAVHPQAQDAARFTTPSMLAVHGIAVTADLALRRPTPGRAAEDAALIERCRVRLVTWIGPPPQESPR